MLEIDGSYGEGGGQLLRTTVALAAITGKSVRIADIRARRDTPGLAPQHLAAVRAVAALCEARTDGLALRSTALVFCPGRLRVVEVRCDVGTAGSITLVLQALLPAMLRAGGPCRATVIGGTDVRQAPPVDYLRHVLLPLLRRMGARIQIDVVRRGYYPRGGGEVAVTVAPGPLRPLRLDAPGGVRALRGVAHTASLPEHIAERMRRAAAERLAAGGLGPAQLETCLCDPAQAMGQGGAVVVWAETDTTVLGAARTAERGVRAEALGEAVGAELTADWNAGATVDLHAADQLLVYLALAGGGSFVARALSSHARTAMWLIEHFLSVRFAMREQGPVVRLDVVPA